MSGRVSKFLSVLSSVLDWLHPSSELVRNKVVLACLIGLYWIASISAVALVVLYTASALWLPATAYGIMGFVNTVCLIHWIHLWRATFKQLPSARVVNRYNKRNSDAS